MIFYLGSHMPNWLSNAGVPLFVSRRRLWRRRSFPRAAARWALDSGAFTELNLYGAWSVSAKQYALEVRRFSEEIGGLDWAAIQDYPCEPFMLERTGLSVEDHQRRTVASYLRLSDLAPDLPWAPVLQGWTLHDYLAHAEMYDAAGIDLHAVPVVGVGSVCRRQHTHEIAGLLEHLASHGWRLHGFGLKLSGLWRVTSILASSDSMAWSSHARRRPALPGCTHRTCANCLRYALRWRERVLESIAGQQISLFAAAAA